MKNKIENSLNKLEKWVEDHNYKGYDPADGLTSYLRPLTFGNLFLDRLLTATCLAKPDQYPSNFRCKTQSLFYRSRLYGLGLPHQIQNHQR